MTFRPAPLRAAAILAAVFIGARVVYRILFDGTDADGPVLLPLPALRLPDPFAHVVLLGPVTAGGLWDAVASAIPIAALILAFGVLNALVDVSRGFAVLARRGPLRAVARMLAIAWATLPALADAVRSVRFAFRLRGERFGARALVPILERTLERASSVAAALELRGFGASSRMSSLAADCIQPVVVRDAVFAPGDPRPVPLIRHDASTARAERDGRMDDASPIRHDVSTVRAERDGRMDARSFAGVRIRGFVPAVGTLTVVTGATGAGKSTLLRGLAGLLPHVDGGSLDGMVRVAGLDRLALAPRETARFVGVVLQNPREAFAAERVRDEIGLALELRGVASVIVSARVAEVAEHVGVAPLLDRPVRTLSAGEATLVAIAAAVVERPILLLVDEPLADLDDGARTRVVSVLDALAHTAGVCVVVAEHRAAAFTPVADAWWEIDRGELVPGSAPRAVPAPRGKPHRVHDAEPVLRVDDLVVERDRSTIVRAASLRLRPGEIVALVGPNGAGKSTLLAALALPAKGMPVTTRGRVALVPDASDDLFTRDTVGAELSAGDRRADAVTGTSAARFAHLLGGEGVDPRRHPRDLSVGQRRCLAITLQSAGDPRVLLIDEPTRGLDASARELIAQALRAAADAGAAVLFATHDPDFAAALGARILPMAAGIVPAAAGDDVTGSTTGAGQPRAGALGPRSPALRGSPRPELDAALPPVVEPASDRAVGRGAGNDRGAVPHAHRRSPRRWPPVVALAAANLVALAAFCWPFVADALPSEAATAVPFAAIAVAPLAAIAVAASLDGSVRSAHMIALLGVLAAVGAAVRVVSSGVGGVEAVFILLILAGRAFGARFGLLLGVATIAISSVMWGGFGPWTPFQMFACAWVGAGAGLLPRRVRGWAEIWMLCAYGVVASYLFGLLMNLWFWPFAVGAGTGISYVPGAPIGQNLVSFLVYSLITSTLSWDTLRAITTVIGVVVIGRAVLASLRRAKPVVTRPRAVVREPVGVR